MLESTIIDKIIEQISLQTVGWHPVYVSAIAALAASFIFWTIASRLIWTSKPACLGKAILVYIVAFFVILGGYSTYLEHDLSKRIQADPDQTVLMTSIKAKIADIEKDVALLRKNEEAYRESRLKNDRSLAVKIFGDDKASLISLAMIFGMLLGAGGTRLVQAIFDRERKMTERLKVYEERQNKINQQTGEHHAESN